MFYLLENNRIIDSKYIDRHFEENGHLKRLNYFEEIIIDLGKIKNQSENIFDFIEVGDLIASYRYSIEGRTNEKEINCVDELFEDENGVGINQCCIVDYDDICAIYKPDANGNYIKVWEKKENE